MRRRTALVRRPNGERQASESVHKAQVFIASPEFAEAVAVKHTIAAGRIQFTVPRFLVYAVARVQLVK